MSTIGTGETRNARDVWTNATQPYSAPKSIAFDLADYVGVDGKPYKVSADCPIHAPMLRSGMFDKAANGGRPVRLQNHNPDTGSCLSVAPGSSPDAKISHSHSEETDASSEQQTIGNKSENRTSTPRPEHILPAETADHTGHKSEPGERHVETHGLPLQSNEWTATGHSKQTNRTDPALQISPRDNASDGSLDRTQNSGQPPWQPDLADRTSANNTEQDDLDGHPSAQTQSHIVHKSSSNTSYCTCSVVSIDHFATFPPELPRRCILAGCPPGGVVLDPFFGSGTVGLVAERELRRWIGIELNPEYCEIARKRTRQQGLFTAEDFSALQPQHPAPQQDGEHPQADS
jgi:hypothetical protein